MGFRQWQDLSSDAIGALDPARTVAVLPLAAIEQHGPHLPTGVDTVIAAGLMAEAGALAPADLAVVALPVQAIGASLEHSRFPGTLSMSAAALTELILAVAAGVAAAGIRKLVLISAHGGNVAAMTSAAFECRARFRMVTVATTFARFGAPAGLLEPPETELGVHGGLAETALMLHFRPDLVDMGRAGNFGSRQASLKERFVHLRAYGPVGFGWLAGDLNPAGVVGNATGATPEIGAAIAAHRAAGFVQLLRELAAADLDMLIAND